MYEMNVEDLIEQLRENPGGEGFVRMFGAATIDEFAETLRVNPVFARRVVQSANRVIFDHLEEEVARDILEDSLDWRIKRELYSDPGDAIALFGRHYDDERVELKLREWRARDRFGTLENLNP
jgi:hypothetical protein